MKPRLAIARDVETSATLEEIQEALANVGIKSKIKRDTLVAKHMGMRGYYQVTITDAGDVRIGSMECHDWPEMDAKIRIVLARLKK